jgi:hypothetical protein
VPLSRGTTLGADDALEMVARLREGQERPADVRPSRVRAMLARYGCTCVNVVWA